MHKATYHLILCAPFAGSDLLNAILERELLSLFRTKRTFAVQAGVAVGCLILIALRWPDSGQADLAGATSREVFILFGYALLAFVVLLVPSFPAASIVQERQQRTLVLLLHSPLTAGSIYFGKLIATLGFVIVLIVLTFPAAAACHAMGGISLSYQLVPLYGVLMLLAVQLGALGLWVSSRARTPESATRMAYGCVLVLVLFTLMPDYFLQGGESTAAQFATQLRMVSPLPAVMHLVGHGDVGQRGAGTPENPVTFFVVLSLVSIAMLATATIRRIGFRMLDAPKSQGTVTDQRTGGQQLLRRLAYLVDPQRRKSEIGPFTNPVMIKEFRTRQFGRLHWLLRLVSGCALASLLLTWATTLSSTSWGVRTIGAIIVVMQMALIVLLTPGLAAGLISGELESGGWKLLRMTPLSPGVILRGKLLSVSWTMVLILCATLPGYIVMVWIDPRVSDQVQKVVTCLVVSAAFSILLSATVSSFIPRTSMATLVSYLVLLLIYAGTILVWLGRDAPFGNSTVEAVLSLNPLAAAFSVIKTPGFATYNLFSANLWIMAGMTTGLVCILLIRIQILLRPD